MASRTDTVTLPVSTYRHSRDHRTSSPVSGIGVPSRSAQTCRGCLHPLLAPVTTRHQPHAVTTDRHQTRHQSVAPRTTRHRHRHATTTFTTATAAAAGRSVDESSRPRRQAAEGRHLTRPGGRCDWLQPIGRLNRRRVTSRRVQPGSGGGGAAALICIGTER